MAKMYIETLEPSFFGTYRVRGSLIHAVAVSLAHGEGGLYIVEAEHDKVLQRATSIQVLSSYTPETVMTAIARLTPEFIKRQKALVEKAQRDWYYRSQGIEVIDFGDDFCGLVHCCVWLRGALALKRDKIGKFDMSEELRAEREYDEEFETVLNSLV